MGKIKCAVVGCGAIAPLHLQAISHISEVTLVAVCDIKKERADKWAQAYGISSYTDYKEMLLTERPDVLHICLPHYLHTEVARFAFENGINVLSEKPMSISYGDAVSAVELAEEKGVLYGVIFQNRYNQSSRFVKGKILDGSLGRVLGARVTLSWEKSMDYYTESDWKGTWEKEGGGVVINQAIHSIDLANWLIDSIPVDVQSSLYNRVHPVIEVEDSAEGLVTYENGAVMAFYVMNNYVIDDSVEVRIACEKGRVILSGNFAKIYYKDGRVEDMENVEEKTPDDKKDYWGNSHGKQISQFYKAVRGEEPLEIDGREALKIQYLVSKIYEGSFENKCLK